MKKFDTTELEQFLDLDIEVICSMEHRDRIEPTNLFEQLFGTTVTTGLTTTGR